MLVVESSNIRSKFKTLVKRINTDNEVMRTKCEYQVLVNQFGREVKFINFRDEETSLHAGGRYEVRTIEVEGDFIDAYAKACELGANPFKNMLFRMLEA